MNLGLIPGMNLHSDDRASWDIFSQSLDDSRALWLLASRLAENPTHRVRVFVEKPASMGMLSARIDDTLWIQPLANYELWKMRLADVVAPADNVVRMNSAEVPPKYLERTAYGAKNDRKILNILPFGDSSVSGEFSVIHGATGLVHINMAQNAGRDGVGLIKAPRGTAEMRTRWRGKSNLARATMDLLGLKDYWSTDAMVTLVSGVALAEPETMALALERSCGRPQLLLVFSSSDDARNGEVQALCCIDGRVTSRQVERVTWGQIDELAWSSDLIFTGHSDMAHRAMEAGAPMIWLGEDEGLLDWYFRDAPSDLRKHVKVAVRHFKAGKAGASGLVWIAMQLEALAALAVGIEQKIARAPALQNSVAEIDGLVENWVKQTMHDRAAFTNTPTVPMGLPR